MSRRASSPAPTSGTTPTSTRSRTSASTRDARHRGGDARRARLVGARRARRRLRQRLPPAAVRPRRRARWSASSRTPPLVELARERRRARAGRAVRGPRRAPPRRCRCRTRSVDVAHARWAYFFGPGCEPGLAELARVLRPGGTAFVIDNDATRSTFGGWFRRSLPHLRPGGGRAVLGPAGLDARAARHPLGLRQPRGPSRRSCGSSSRPRSPTASSPSTRAPASTTPSTSGGAPSLTAAGPAARRPCRWALVG